MPEQNDFLVEIGTEELPPKSLKKLVDHFADSLLSELNNAKLHYGTVERFASPRRLAIVIHDLDSTQPDQKIVRSGPYKSAAFDQGGKPTPAAMGFAKSCGVELDELDYEETEKGLRLFFEQHISGKTTPEVLPEMIENALQKLPISKPMRWGNYDTKFVRPVHWVIMIMGDEVVSGEILGKQSQRTTRGHRFHTQEAIEIPSPREYEKTLEKIGYVIPSFEKRRAEIKKQLEKFPEKVVIDEALLDEVTALVEWPIALKGHFEERFLAVPEEVLTTTMKVNQKCFSMVDPSHSMLPNFVTISNIDSKNKTQVIEGNERVIRARLSDAEFFFEVDKKSGLESKLDRLKGVIFQAKLGTMQDKCNRVRALSRSIALQIDADENNTDRAAELCKADLLTEMVCEFPELQGTMGYYYAKVNGENDIVSTAIKEHYYPRHAGDSLPDSKEACAVSIADKIDTLVGIFGINQAPTGVKDPYGLRRAAIGILRIMIEKSLPIDLEKLLIDAESHYKNKLENDQVVEQCFNFITDRLKNYYSDHGISQDVFASVEARCPKILLDFDNRINAVEHFKNLPEAKALAAANKRVKNILKKQDADFSNWKINSTLFENTAEQNLADLLEKKNKKLSEYFQKEKYTEALSELATLQEPVDCFFDNVLVMDENDEKRNNRLALLSNLRELFLKVADISLLQQG